MAKFLVVLALAIVVFLIVSRIRGGKSAAAPKSPAASAKPEDMVRCAVCGVHLPRSESFTSHGTFFCSDEHRRLSVQEPRKP